MSRRAEITQKNKDKKRKLNVLDIITLSVIVILLAIYAPRAWSLYEERRAYLEEAKKEKVIEYPLEVEITEQDTKFLVNFFNSYAIGITSPDINLFDGITENEMIDFCRAILSEKYSSSGVIAKTAMDNAIKKYFDVSGLSYENLGYKSLKVYENYEAKKVFNVTKLMQLEKDSDLYLVYADCVDKSKVHEETYKKDDIEDVYIFTFKKIVTEKQDETLLTTEINYILQKVEKEVTEKSEENLENNSESKNK